MQAVFSPSFLPTAEAEQEKEGHDIVHTLLSNDQNCCIINTSSHTQNLGCSEGSYLYPSQIVCCTKTNFYILALEKGPTNDKIG